MKKNFLLVVLLLCSFNLFAQSLEGVWLTGDSDPLKRVKVEITKKGDNYFGKIIAKNPKAPLTCSFCKGTYKDKTTVGAQILKELVQDEKDPNKFNGKIYNPEDDGTYKSYLELSEDGNKLKVVGKWLVFSKKQTWTRLQ